MKKLLICLGLLWSVVANAQFVPGQLLTAAELNTQFALYAPLAGATFTGPVTVPSITGTSTTQGRLDNSTSIATDAFVNQQAQAAVATVPFANVTGGLYNQATLGSGGQVVIFASGGVVSSILAVATPGSGYAVGDILALPGGNSDALIRVATVSGSGIATASVIYGGSGYTTGAQLATMGLPAGRRAVNFTGTLTSNLTFIIQNGTFLTASRELEFINNTTGAFTITIYVSNGAGGHTGTGVVLPQGTNNSTAMTLYTDGVNDIWPANPGGTPASVPLANLASQAANTVVANVTSGSASPAAAPLTSCSAATSAMSYTSGTGFGCNTAINAATLGGATFASPGAIGGTTASSGKFTTLQATSTITPSTTSGIVGTTLGDNANAGSVGETISSTIASGSAIALTTVTNANVTSISLTAGDWDVDGMVQYVATGATATSAQSSFSTVSATLDAVNNNFTFMPLSGTTITVSAPIPPNRLSLSATTTVYLVARCNFTVGTMSAYGFIVARRRR